jgi:hypothetical protein
VQRRHRASLTVFGRISESRVVNIPASPSTGALAAFQKLRFDIALVIANTSVDRILNGRQTARDYRDGDDLFQIFDSFQEFINSHSDSFNRFSCLCFIRKERVALLWSLAWKTHAENIEPVITRLLAQFDNIMQPKVSCVI